MATPTAPTPKEQGRRPDPFMKQSDYEVFKRQLTTFFIANDAIYDTEIKKILFTLSYMTEGTPGAWAQYRIEQAQTQAVAGCYEYWKFLVILSSVPLYIYSQLGILGIISI